MSPRAYSGIPQAILGQPFVKLCQAADFAYSKHHAERDAGEKNVFG